MKFSKKAKIISSVCLVLVILLGVGGYAGYKTFVRPDASDDYYETVSSYSFWTNTAETSIPVVNTYYHVQDFLSECEIVDGDAISPDGKIRKVLFLGFDGMRPDALTYVLDDENSDDYVAYNSLLDVSGFEMLYETGGIYMAFCGGETGTETEQTTSTSANWTSHFTGVWGNDHGILDNGDTKNMEYKTYMLQYAELGLSTSLSFDWDTYFDTNLKEEVAYVMQNDLPMVFCDIDRDIATSSFGISADSLELYNFVAPETASISAPYDTGLRDYVLSRIDLGDDIVVGIFDTIDHAGHIYGFGESTRYTGTVINCDMYAAAIVDVINEREELYNEQWLIIFANDHGGLGMLHGSQTLEERTTWIATNIAFDEQYYSIGYDGYTTGN